MKSIEEICDRYNRTPEEVESDLYAVLKELSGKGRSEISDFDYKHELKLCLVKRSCLIADLDGTYISTKEGERVLQRGWISRDYKALKAKEKETKLIKYWTLVAGIITAVATLLTAFLTIFQ
jgi:hypothetical protein